MKRPDLLHACPVVSVRNPGLSQALTFAFASGVEEGSLLELAAPPIAESTFESRAFAGDLFLKELVARSFPLPSSLGREVDSNYFHKVLVSPPKDLEALAFRQNILSELTQVEERRDLLQLAYCRLRHFRKLLCESGHYSSRSVSVQRRIDILVALRRSLDSLLSATGNSSSGLERVAIWIEKLRGTEAYLALDRLLSFEDGRSVLETRLQVGYDGSLTRFEIVKTSTLAHQAFPRSGLSRFFRRVLSLVKGYRFSEEDIMSRLLDQVYSNLEEAVACILVVSLQVEFYLRALSFRDLSRKRGLAVCLPTVVKKEETNHCRVLRGLFNPWIAAEGSDAVPCDFVQERVPCTTIVTGPNSGGKTRLMQSLAVAQLLGQGGLFVPAQEATIPEVEQLFLSLLEHTQPDQREGRLGQELMRVREVFETSGPHSLVLMDELCSGTNPSEGERIFQMVLELFAELHPQVLITTHFLDFAQRLFDKKDESLAFLQVEMDAAELPTYQFVEGVAGTSLARNTASRLGVTREELLTLIRKHKR